METVADDHVPSGRRIRNLSLAWDGSRLKITLLEIMRRCKVCNESTDPCGIQARKALAACRSDSESLEGLGCCDLRQSGNVVLAGFRCTLGEFLSFPRLADEFEPHVLYKTSFSPCRKHHMMYRQLLESRCHQLAGVGKRQVLYQLLQWPGFGRLLAKNCYQLLRESAPMCAASSRPWRYRDPFSLTEPGMRSMVNLLRPKNHIKKLKNQV